MKISSEILNEKPINAFRKKKTGKRYKYFQEHHGIEYGFFQKETTITGILIGKEIQNYLETYKSLGRIVKGNIITLPTTNAVSLNKALDSVKKGWCLIMLAGEKIDDVTAIAIQHYIKTIDYDAWNMYIKKKNDGKWQTRLIKHYASFENGHIKNIVCIGTALQGEIKETDG